MVAIIAKDKQAHLAAGCIIGSCFGWNWLLGGICLLLIAAGKELIYDLALHRGTPDVWDFVATVAGGILPIIFWQL